MDMYLVAWSLSCSEPVWMIHFFFPQKKSYKIINYHSWKSWMPAKFLRNFYVSTQGVRNFKVNLFGGN